jgi:hypothetical protein
MRFLSSLLFLFFTNFIFSQSTADASTHFDRFEYAETIAILEAKENTSSFELDQLKQLGYSYYAVGNFEKALPIFDAVLASKPIEAYFYYLQAESYMALGQTEKALSAYELYQQKDGSTDVSLRIASAKASTSWVPMEVAKIVESSFNHNKASTLGQRSANGFFVFKEIGVNKKGDILSEADDINSSELMLMRPYLATEGLTPLVVTGIDRFWSIHAIAVEPNSKRALVSVSKPLENKEVNKMVQLYEGVYNSDNVSLEIVKPWKTSGLDNALSTGFASFNNSGNFLLFCASSESTKGVDIFSSIKGNDGEWSSPLPVNEINTVFDDVYPNFIGDTLLTFSSNGRVGYGGLDLYQVKIADFKPVQSSIEHFTAPVNSFKDDFNLQIEGDSLMSLTSNRLASTTDDNIFHIYLPSKEVPVEEPPIDTNAEFLAAWEIKYLYFDFDKFDILRDSKHVDFNGLKSFLVANPSFKIELIGKTDSRGTEKYNFELGLKRAESVKSELISFGFNAEQIEVKSKGMTEPLIDCSKSSGCSEEEHAKNRVVMIELIH